MILINSSPKNALKIFQPFLPIFVPIGIGCLLAVAEKEGIKAKVVDQQIEDDVLGLIDRYVREMDKPYIFGFSVLTAAFKEAVVLSQELKRRYPDSIIVFGGVHPTAIPEEVLSYKQIDVVIRGEAENTLMDFYRHVKGRKDFSHLENISYRDNGKIVHNKPNYVLIDLDYLPPFPYHLFTSNRYDMGFVLSSRGCPHKCIFCSNRITTGLQYRYKSAAMVADDIGLVYHKYKYRDILFIDDNFLINKRRTYLLLDEIKKRGLHKKVSLKFQARGDNVTPRLLKDLYDAGSRSIFFGLETSSDRIMKIIKKGESVQQCIEAVRMAKNIGFHVSATFMYALPTETFQDRMNCVKLSKELGLDMVRYNNATPYPGTQLYEIAKKQNRLNIQELYENFNSVSTFIENPFKKIPFSYIPERNSEDEIRRDILFSYFSFYLDKERLKDIFTSPDKGVGWFDTGEKLKDILKKIPGLIVLAFALGTKFWQLFYYIVIKRKTAISFSHFLKIFSGLGFRGKSKKETIYKN